MKVDEGIPITIIWSKRDSFFSDPEGSWDGVVYLLVFKVYFPFPKSSQEDVNFNFPGILNVIDTVKEVDTDRPVTPK